MADRFFAADLPPSGTAFLDGDEAHHLARVRRVAVGETVEVFNGLGRAHRAVVRAILRDRVELELTEPGRESPDGGNLTLACATPKGDRFDWLIEKATEIGVARFVPIRSERSVADPRSTKLDRLRRTVIEACKQCGRNRLMAIDPVCDWADLVRTTTAAVRLVAHPGGLGLADWPKSPADAEVILAVGPEGGFSPAEIDAACASGWTRVSLGRNILRIETAGLVGSAVLLTRIELSEPS